MKGIVNDAVNRAYQLAWPSCVQWSRAFNYELRTPRYPAPASEPIDHEANYMDYKTSYRDSIHNIRHLENYEEHSSKHFISDPLRETPEQKLVRLRYLRKDQVSDQESIMAATAEYQKNHGELPTNRVYANEQEDEAWDTLRAKNFSRESMSFFVREQFQSYKEANQELSIIADFEDLYHPEVQEIKHLDMFSADPVFRQMLVDQHWIFEQICVCDKQNFIWEKKEKELREGVPENIQRRFQLLACSRQQFRFKYLINYTEIKGSIKQIQSSIGDKVSNLEIISLDHSHNLETYHKTVDLPFPIKTKFVE